MKIVMIKSRNILSIYKPLEHASRATELIPLYNIYRLSRLFGEHPREVDARGEALLPQRPHHPRRKQKGGQVTYDSLLNKVPSL